MRGRPDRVRQPAGRGTGRRAVPDAGAEARGGWCVAHDRQRPRAARADAAEACMAARKRRCAVPPLCSWDNEVVSTPGASAATGREQDAIEALTEARERTLALVASLTDDELARLSDYELDGYEPAPSITPPDGAPPTGLELIEIPAGQCTIGAPPADTARDAGWAAFAYDNERPRHRTDVRAFRIGRHPVTNATFLHFVEGGGY